MESAYNFKDYQLVSLPSTPSALPNNLSAGENSFVYVTNAEPAPRCFIFDKLLFEKADTQNTITVRYKEFSDILNAKLVRIEKQWYVVLSLVGGAQIWNYNGSRLSHFIATKSAESSIDTEFFICATSATDNTCFMGTSSGKIYGISYQGGSFSHQVSYEHKENQAITSLTYEEKLGLLIAGTSNGKILVLDIDKASLKLNKQIENPADTAVTSLDILHRGQDLLAASFGDGHLKVFTLPNGKELIRASAHSRSISAIACHPTRSLIVTVGEDSYVNLFEVTGEKLEKLDFEVVLSSRILDHMPTGVCFVDANSFIVTTYDSHDLVYFNNVI